ncbi:esterase-like activity of phytase family protein [Sphingomonas sp. Tas61C01]|uniref:esterase-like activity of phytase family protein n=1 Tax=Sphingomonas sp. Tas61C01 TaxID=3458297 RepID=UPI00403E86B1
MRILFVILCVLLIVPGWTREERVTAYPARPTVTVIPVKLDPDDPARRRVGALTFLGGVSLSSATRGFGGFSSIAVAGDRFALLSDSGNMLRFRLDAGWRIHDVTGVDLPAGPGTGWDKRDRDSESMVVDSAGKHLWVGFERANQIWRYSADLLRADGRVAPPAMKRWPSNGGAEAMARLRDGRFVVISEEARVPKRRWPGRDDARKTSREGLIFPRDPLAGDVPKHFTYLVHPKFDVADAVALPGGDLLVVERRFQLPYRFTTIVTRVAAADIAENVIARPREVATLASPLIHDNFEGIAVAREGTATIIWLVSDDNQSLLQRSLLLKFRLDRRP